MRSRKRARRHFVPALFLAFAACAESTGNLQAPAARNADPIRVTGGYTAEEYLFEARSASAPVRLGRVPTSFFLYSYSLDGRYGSIWPGELASLTGKPPGPGSRTINWVILCDPIRTSSRKCRAILQPAGIANNAGGLALEFDARARLTSVRVLGHDAAGRRASISVDNAPAFETGEDGRVPSADLRRLERSLERAETILTRRYRGPSDKPQSRSTHILGSYVAARNFLRWYLVEFKPRDVASRG